MSRDSELEAQYSTFRALVDSFTPEEAAQRLRQFRIPDEIIERIVERHERETKQIRELDDPPAVHDLGRRTWYTGPREGDVMWPAFAAMLQQAGIVGDNFERIDDSSSKIVSFLDHPATAKFTTYGLVVGHVQSGKTTNFTAVMAKAADRRYRLFIVLSGIHNALRRQTQVRVSHDLVSHNPALWYEVTRPEHDFRLGGGAAAFVAAQGQHVLLVVKKNAAVLRRLQRWLEAARPQLDNCPTLIIDDEADQSTVATKKINPLLAEVVATFPKVAYVGYTATPFANLLIDPANLKDFYPRHFVVNLPRADGYYGTEVLFGRDALDGEDAADIPGGYDMIRCVPDDEVDCLRPPKGAANFEPAVTPSLQSAIEYFVLATAARRVRGTGNEHSTMLLHTTVQTGVHAAFRVVVEAYLWRLRHDIGRQDAERLRGLRELWLEETARVPAEDFDESVVTFAELQGRLDEVLGDLRVIVDNSRSHDRLDYESGPVTAIAIGGNTLSRGLTLEGLVVSFFVRAVSAYDTLLQMGRWFGYRHGYADLPRIWLTRELSEWFRHLATVEEEVRRDVDRYLDGSATPLTLAVRMRTHPKLAITAAAKMRDAVKASASYGGQLLETRYFKVGPEAEDWLAGNERAARHLVERILNDGLSPVRVDDDRLYVENVPSHLVTEFLSAYAFHEKSYELQAKSLVSYVEKRNTADALLSWSVGIIGNRRASARQYEFVPGIEVGMVTRARLQDSPDEAADIKTLTSRRDELVDLRVEQSASELTHKRILDLRRAQRPDVGLLLLYPINPESRTDTRGRKPLNAPHDVVMGVALVFPEPIGDDDEVTYYSADLSDVYVEEDDLEALEGSDDEP